MGLEEVTEQALHTDEIRATLFSLPFVADSKGHCSQEDLVIIPESHWNNKFSVTRE
jgi:hypothetical protein